MKLKILVCIWLCSLAQWTSADDLRGDTLDIHSYQLNLDLCDFDTHILYANAVIDIHAKANGVDHINLDLLKLKVDSITENGKPVTFAYNDSLLGIQFSKLLNKGDSAVLNVYYHGKPGVVTGDFGGFYWDDQYAFNIGVSFVSNPHNYGRVWFPCFDNFKVRSHYEYFIRTRPTDKAFCNGTLNDVKRDSSSSVWHWKLEEPIPSYLASVAVAAYQTLQDTVIGKNGVVPVEIAALAEDTADVKKYFRHLHQAFHILEHYWGPYNWERVGYCIVPFDDGAMEHATNIAFMQNYLNAYAKECETTMAHELSHHWFGNLVTCDSAPEMWLNEGWATYSQSLFIEGLYGSDSARQYRRDEHLTELTQTHVADNGYLPVSGVPSKYAYGSTVYQKGGDVINTLRYYLGDSVFFSCVKGYLKQYAFSTAGTLQLRDYLSSCSGRDLTDFFDEWVLSPGYPHFSISDKYIMHVGDKYEVSINIRQRLSHAPKLYNNVPLTVSYFNADLQRKDERILVNGEFNTYTATLNFKPWLITLDADENLAEAISSEQRVLRDTGIYDFNNALMSVQVNVIKDSSLIRVEQNWIGADAMIHPVRGLHLNTVRFWTLDGVFDPAMKATGIFPYSATPGDHMDGNFIINEDSLVMMYRPNQHAEWKKAGAFFVDKEGSDSDNVGAIVVSPLKKGDYAMAVYNSQLPDEKGRRNDFVPISKAIKAGVDFKIHFDAASKSLVIDFEKNIFERVEVFSGEERMLGTKKIAEEDNNATFQFNPVSGAGYIVILTTKTGKRVIKKLNN